MLAWGTAPQRPECPVPERRTIPMCSELAETLTNHPNHTILLHWNSLGPTAKVPEGVSRHRISRLHREILQDRHQSFSDRSAHLCVRRCCPRNPSDSAREWI